MSSTDSTRKIPRWPPESAGFSTAGKPTSSAARWRSDSLRTAANRGCGTPGLGERPPHRDLVRHQVRRLRPDPRQPARLGDCGHDGHGAVGRHRQHAVERLALDRLEHRLDVREVDDEAAVGIAEPERVRVAVDGQHAQPELLRPQDRVPLVASRADEEDGLHSLAMLLVSLVPRIGG